MTCNDIPFVTATVRCNLRLGFPSMRGSNKTYRRPRVAGSACVGFAVKCILLLAVLFLDGIGNEGVAVLKFNLDFQIIACVHYVFLDVGEDEVGPSKHHGFVVKVLADS